MITQISGLDTRGVTKKDPRRKAQSVQFRKKVNIPYKQGIDAQYVQQKKNALWTSVSIVAGAVLFTVGYFLLAGMKNAKNAL